MPRYLYKIQLLGFLVALMFVRTATAKAVADDPVIKAKLEETIAKVREEKPSLARTAEAEHLAELTHRIKPASVDDATVADMVSLLGIPDDSVRGWVAAALGNLGRRAKEVAAPKLLALLPEADCLQGDLTSAASIRPALRRMGVKPPPFDPQDCK